MKRKSRHEQFRTAVATAVNHQWQFSTPHGQVILHVPEKVMTVEIHLPPGFPHVGLASAVPFYRPNDAGRWDLPFMKTPEARYIAELKTRIALIKANILNPTSV